LTPITDDDVASRSDLRRRVDAVHVSTHGEALADDQTSRRRGNRGRRRKGSAKHEGFATVVRCAQKSFAAHEREVMRSVSNPRLGSTTTDSDHDVPSYDSMAPSLVPAKQSGAVGHETAVNP